MKEPKSVKNQEQSLLETKIQTLFNIKTDLKTKKHMDIARQSWKRLGYKDDLTSENIDKAVDKLNWHIMMPFTMKQGLYLLSLVKKYDLAPLAHKDYHQKKVNYLFDITEFKFQSIVDNIKVKNGKDAQKVAVANHSANTADGQTMNANDPKLMKFDLYSYHPKTKKISLVTYDDINGEFKNDIKTLKKIA